MPDDRPTAWILCGPTGCGKTTARREILASCPDAVVASSDDYLEALAKGLSSTYAQVFDDFYSEARRSWLDRMNLAVDRWRPVIVDRTHMSPEARLQTIAILKDSHHLIALAPSYDLKSKETFAMLAERAKNREDRPGPKIGRNQIVAQIKLWVPPGLEEGFDEIHEVIGAAMMQIPGLEQPSPSSGMEF